MVVVLKIHKSSVLYSQKLVIMILLSIMLGAAPCDEDSIPPLPPPMPSLKDIHARAKLGIVIKTLCCSLLSQLTLLLDPAVPMPSLKELCATSTLHRHRNFSEDDSDVQQPATVPASCEDSIPPSPISSADEALGPFRVPAPSPPKACSVVSAWHFFAYVWCMVEKRKKGLLYTGICMH